MRWSERLAAAVPHFHEILPSTRSDTLSRQPSLILFSLDVILVRAIIRRWPFAFGAFSAHTLVVLLATINWATGSGLEPEMRWLWLLFLDVPVSGAYLRFVSFAHGELIAITSFFFGGAQ